MECKSDNEEKDLYVNLGDLQKQKERENEKEKKKEKKEETKEENEDKEVIIN